MNSKKNILIISSTIQEIEPFLDSNFVKKSENLFSFTNKKRKTFDVLICGVGISLSTYNVTKQLASNKYDLAINIGISGSFNNNINIGETVFVESDCFADFGIEHDNYFISMFDTKFIDKNKNPFENGKLVSKKSKFLNFENFKSVKSITVNKTSGSEKTINERIKMFSPDIETMEGAAIMFVCKKENIEFIQIRAISNIIAERSKQVWNTELAIENLNKILVEIIGNL